MPIEPTHPSPAPPPNATSPAQKLLPFFAWLLLIMLALMILAGILQEAGVIHNDNPFPWLKVMAVAMGAGLAAIKWLRSGPPKG